MRYSSIVVFRTRPSPDGKIVEAHRVSEAHGYVTVVPMSFKALYAGHCQWIADDIKAREDREAANVAKRRRAA